MLSFTEANTFYSALTGNNSTANASVGARSMNEGIRFMLGDVAWPFLERSATQTTTASTQAYNLPADVRKVLSVTLTVGTYRYRPQEVASITDWDFINSPTGVSNNNPSYYFVFNKQVLLWPTPSSSSLTLTVNYQKSVRDISVADYTTGSIVSVAAAGFTVVGTGTAWTSQMAGRFLRITMSNAANTGDGLWYEIASVQSATSLTLTRPYLGTAIAAGTAAYTIGDCMIIPESYQSGPVYFAASEYWRTNGDQAKANSFQDKYERLMAQMRDEEGRRTTNYAIDSGFGVGMPINPNLNPTVTGP